jgi:hypothetical protein
MKGNATISGNTTSSSYGSGGGVYISGSAASGYGSFVKTGGVIYGSNADTALRNVAGSGGGAAVFVDATHKRETTVGTGQTMSKSGTTYTGSWTD